MERLFRRLLLKCLTGEREIHLANCAPSRADLAAKFDGVDTFGLYIHIPFCQQICPYCPYNKEIYHADAAAHYVQAIKKEMDLYSTIAGNKAVTSLYIGGGTPTTMLHSGLCEIIEHLHRRFNIQCGIHMESHPNHLSDSNLAFIKSMGIQHLSIGVEALFDHHLQTLCRPYTVRGVKDAVARAVATGFTCVNVDIMFALPGQTYEEIEETGRELVRLGVDQVAAYPLFRFAYTQLGRTNRVANQGVMHSVTRRRMLRILERIFYDAGYVRSSTWAFTRRGVPRYCSVTVPLYVGLGASGGTYLRDIFYLNTFGVNEYVNALAEDRLPIALSVDLSERMQRAGWLYWRIYETQFSRADYHARFGEEIDFTFGRMLHMLGLLGYLNDDGKRITLSDRGSFWLHACEDMLSIDYINKLWGASKRNCWPKEVVLL